jgi:Spy/CpxP family protein refolding chaperone
MKPYLRLFYLLAAVAVVAAASHVFCHRLGCGKPAVGTSAPEHVCWHNADWLAGKLKLTPEQKAKVEALNAEYVAALESTGAMHRELHAQLNTALFDADAPPEKDDALLAEMSRARLAADRATIRHIRAVAALLTPEQRKLFQKLFACHCGGAAGPAKQE